MTVQPEGGHWVAGIIVLGPETEEGREVERAGAKGTEFEDMTDNEAVAEKERGGVYRARLLLSQPRPQTLKCDPDPTWPPTPRRKVAGG